MKPSQINMHISEIDEEGKYCEKWIRLTLPAESVKGIIKEWETIQPKIGYHETPAPCLPVRTGKLFLKLIVDLSKQEATEEMFYQDPDKEEGVKSMKTKLDQKKILIALVKSVGITYIYFPFKEGNGLGISGTVLEIEDYIKDIEEFSGEFDLSNVTIDGSVDLEKFLGELNK